jgi:DNA-binding IclR family transcriptional regulator
MTESDAAGRYASRIAEILDCFTVEDPVHNLTEISKRVGLAKSTTHRLIATLVGQGFLMRDASGRGYQLGYHMLRWGMVAQASLDLRAEALPILRELCKTVEETSLVTIRNGTRGLYLDIVESNRPVRLAMRAGQLLHLHAGASSKVLLAFLPETEIQQILSGLELVRLAPNTITEPEALREELRTIRQRGYSTSFEETDIGAMGIASPVYDHSGKPIAGIGIAAPLTRIPPEQVPDVAVPIVDAARRLSSRLGAPCCAVDGKR